MASSVVPVVVRAVTSVDAERAFDAIAPIDLSRIFTGYGPLPGVRGVRDQSGAWDHEGATRVVLLTDGNEAPERITSFDRPRAFAYEVGPFGGAFDRVVARAEGDWVFGPAADGGSGTEIAWTYAFVPRPRMGVVVRLVVAPLWRRYATRVLTAAVQVAEDGA